MTGSTFNVSIAENLAGSNAYLRTSTGKRSYSNSSGVTDAYSRRSDASRVHVDTAAITDALTRWQIFGRHISEAWGVTDAITVEWLAIAFVIALSTHIDASGEDTTALLTAPAGKTSADFDAGRIQDDETPADDVTLGTDSYTEFEWCLQATDGAEDEADYEFRVVFDDGSALDFYDEYPVWTIAEASGVTYTIEQSESLGLANAFQRLSDAARAYADTLAIAEALNRIADASRGLTDSVAASVAFARVATALRGYVDTLSLENAFARIAELNRSLVDTFGLEEVFDVEWSGAPSPSVTPLADSTVLIRRRQRQEDELLATIALMYLNP